MASVTKAAMLKAAEYSRDCYESNFKADHRRTVEQFSVPGELAVYLLFEKDKSNAYVVFRGTKSEGNWGFTNFQAYKTDFGIIDTELKNVAGGERIQGGDWIFPVEGKIHQGFYRSISWLWYGTEPILEFSANRPTFYWMRAIRDILFIGVPTLIGKASGNWLIGLTVGVLLALAVVEYERGTVEGIFRRSPKKERWQASGGFSNGECAEQRESEIQQGGTILSAHLPILSEYQNVWFVGHSLGGALAVLAFALYKAWWVRQRPLDEYNARIITFGAPGIGDVVFHEAFERANRERFWNVEAANDLVPELPPYRAQRYINLLRRNLLGAPIAGLSLVWQLYSFLWGQDAAGSWKSAVLIGGKWFTVRGHQMDSYIRLIEDWKNSEFDVTKNTAVQIKWRTA